MTRKQENDEAYKKFLEINAKWNLYKDMQSKDYRAWVKELRTLQIDLCDSVYWCEYINYVEMIKSMT